MNSTHRLAALALVAVVAVACQAPMLPLSAQQGSSALIPIGTINEVSTGKIGYGGSLKADLQRGSLVYRLDAAGGLVLPTYTTTLIPATPGSSFGIGGNSNTASWMAVSLVDIPVNAPLGSHSLYVTHEVAGLVEVVPYLGTIKILPSSITVDLEGGGTETINGAPTRISGALVGGGPFGGFGSYSAAIVPNPQLLLGGSTVAHAVELEVSYPTAIMDVSDVFERTGPSRGTGHPALVWFHDDAAAGRVSITAVSASDAALSPLAVAFKLTGTTRLNPTAVTVTVGLATDVNGTAFAYSPTKWIE
jgi:hypothetical protein